MFYEIVFYTIAIGFPIYQLYRGAVDTKKKEAKMTERLNRLDDKFTLIETQIDQISSLTSLAKHPNDVLLEATLESLLLPHHLHIG